MKLDVVTIFPEYLAPLKLSLLGKARNEGLIEINNNPFSKLVIEPEKKEDTSNSNCNC